MAPKLTLSQFIQKANQVHNSNYSYEKTTYQKSNIKTTVTCNVHGNFSLTPNNHLSGKGCPECALIKRANSCKLTIQEFIKKANKVHLNKYDYSNSVYLGMDKKISIICPVSNHGEFSQLACNHVFGKGCPKCKSDKTSLRCRHSTKDFIRKAKEIHGNTYDYSMVDYISGKLKIKIICKEHGIFEQVPQSHLSDSGCPKCVGFNSTFEDFIREAKLIHGDKYDYSLVNETYKNTRVKIPIICPVHGQFFQTPFVHLRGNGCNLCGYDTTAKKRTLTTSDFIERSKLIHNNFYDYSKSIYIKNKTEISICCPLHGLFTQSPNNHLAGKGCPKCVGRISKEEIEVADFLKSLNVQVQTSNKSILNTKELDIVLPDFKIAVEYNGLYWHSSASLSFGKYNHYNKTQECLEKGYRLVHIFSDDWKFKKEIIQSILSNFVNKTQIKYFARKCICKKIQKDLAVEFLNKNHLQGYVISSFHYGLFYNDKLLQVMSFKKDKQNFNLVRLAAKLNIQVVGGANKLFKHFCRNEEFKSVFTFADLYLFNGRVYEHLGFKKIKEIPIDYSYVYKGKRKHKFGFRRKRLKTLLNNFDETKSELWNTRNNGIYRIYDCGKNKYEFVKNT